MEKLQIKKMFITMLPATKNRFEKNQTGQKIILSTSVRHRHSEAASGFVPVQFFQDVP